MSLQIITALFVRGIAFVLMVLLCLWMLILPNLSFAGIAVIPIDEVEFESPALPTPLWRTNVLIVKEILLSDIQTLSEKEQESVSLLNIQTLKKEKNGSQSQFRILSSIRPTLSYEHVDGSFGQVSLENENFAVRPRQDIDYNGDVFSAYLKLSGDLISHQVHVRDAKKDNPHEVELISKISFGTIAFYDSFDLNSFSMDRAGLIVFGKYQFSLNNFSEIGFALSGYYVRNMIDNKINKTFQDYNTLGGNVGVVLDLGKKRIRQYISLDKRIFDPKSYIAGGLSVSYQSQKDNVTREDIENLKVVKEVDIQHLIMVGGNAGLRVYRNLVLTLYLTFNYDLTSYKGSLRNVDDNYFDIAAESSWTFSKRGRLNIGYKKLLFHQNIDIDQVLVGVSWKF